MKEKRAARTCAKMGCQQIIVFFYYGTEPLTKNVSKFMG